MCINKRPRGFSMIELMFVIMIIGIIAAIVLPNYIKFTKKAKEAVVKENMHTVQLAMESFAVKQLGVYPKAADEVALRTLLPQGRYPDNPFTNVQTVVDWNADPVAAGEMGIFNLPGGGCRIRGHGATVRQLNYSILRRHFFIACAIP